MQPKFKETIPYFVLEKEIQVGEEEGVASFIADPDGSVTLLATLLDGNHSVEHIVALMREQYPSIPKHDIVEAIHAFDRERYLEDATCQPEQLTPYLAERYKANLNYFSLFTDLYSSKYAIQEKINTCRVALLGIGGLGSQILYHLAALGFHHITALDFDKLELSNFNRQLMYSEADIGTLKTTLAQKRVQQFNPNVEIQVREQKIASARDVAAHIEDVEYLVCVADRPTLRIHHWVNEVGVQRGIPMVFSGILNTRGRFFSIVPRQTGCVQCHLAHIYAMHPKARLQRAAMEGSHFQHKNAAISPNVAMLAGAMVNELLNLVTGLMPPRSLGRVLEFDFVTYQTRAISAWPKQDDCPVCGVAYGEKERRAARAAVRAEPPREG